MPLLRENLIFLRKYLSDPKRIGSVTPSSKYLGQAMLELISRLEKVKVVEVGAGTGSITIHLQHLSPVVIEVDAELYRLLRHKFDHAEIVHDCALAYLGRIESPIGLVVSIPLINNPFRTAFIERLRALYQDGKLKWCVIYTYGRRSPLGDIDFRQAQRARWVWRNVPPASIWIYT